MATSGTVGRTTIDVATVVEHAARKCGVLTSTLTGEQLLAARENLFLILTSLTNRGLNLWCVQHVSIPLIVGRSTYAMPIGTVDLLRGLFRYGTYTAATSYATTSAIADYGSATMATAATLTAPTAGDYTLVLESSADGSTWNQRGSASWPDAAVGDLMGIDASDFVAARYWRVRETVLTVTMAAATFLSATTEIAMGVLNRDDYVQLPSKSFASTNVLQYWYDKQAIRPSLHLWPVAQTAGPQVVAWIQRQIQDIGALANTLDVPQRWLNAIIFELGARTCLELPKDMVPPDRYTTLMTQAERFTREAEDGERDGAPIRIAPAIGCYTRG